MGSMIREHLSVSHKWEGSNKRSTPNNSWTWGYWSCESIS